MNLTIGQRMRDRVTGFAGIAVTMTDFLTGNKQFSLETSIGGLSGAESRSFDVHQLELVGDGIAAIPAPDDTGITLGHKVKDIVSGITGIATLKTTFLNGCIYYTVVSEAAKGATEIKDIFVEYRRLQNVSVGVAETIAKKFAKEEKCAATGGPAYQVPTRG